MKKVQTGKSPKVLVIDVGGTNIKLLATGQKDSRKIASGPSMTASKMVREVKNCTKDWIFNRVSLGYPDPVINGHPLREPHNLGGGWMKFNFREAFGCPVKVINDAAMQALGSYKGGRMLFLGLGTGLGSAMIVDGILEPRVCRWSCNRRRLVGICLGRKLPTTKNDDNDDAGISCDHHSQE